MRQPPAHITCSFLCILCLGADRLDGKEPVEFGPVAGTVERVWKAWDVPGVVVAVVQGDDVRYLKAHGVRELGKPEPVTPDTVFPLASCTKAFTTTLIAKLVDDGRLGWDDPVRKHLPYFKLSDPNADALVTLRDLVSHRTGVAPHDMLWYRSTATQEEMIRRAGRLPLSKPFRTAMQYQSVLFAAAGHAAAAAAEKPWDELVREHLFIPLGMKSASTRTADALKGPDHASGHKKDREGAVVGVPWYRIEEPNPAGSVNASARDLAAWLSFHLGEGEYQGERLVTAEPLRATHSPETILRLEGKVRAENPDTHQMSYAMGWVVQDYRGHRLVSHAGMIDGFRVHLTMVPEKKLGIAILCNLQGTRMNLSLSNQIVDLLLGLPPRDWDTLYKKLVADDELSERLIERRLDLNRRKGTRPSLALEKYAGVYEHEAYGKATVERDGDGLVLVWGGFRCPLEHYHFETFRVRGEDLLERALLEFRPDRRGTVSGYTLLDVPFKRATGP